MSIVFLNFFEKSFPSHACDGKLFILSFNSTVFIKFLINLTDSVFQVCNFIIAVF